ncbi:hypothetical protein F5Y17DRAFT_7894 [Xylariaceae sp. FL0594]|nr:hypothetical protein F5Y17DRAFT_7894 [Xylariaceae sp. FL0594]
MAAPAKQELTKMWRTGLKQVFMPSAVIQFLMPRNNTPPTFATFKVPLTFNKFDIRDYLLHAYQTQVVSVRSQLRAQPIRRSKSNNRIHRPPPIKTMTVQLAKPFVWPSAPTDVKPWRSAVQTSMLKQGKRARKAQNLLVKNGVMPLRDTQKRQDGRVELKKEAQNLLKNGGWENKRELDPRFSSKK